MGWMEEEAYTPLHEVIRWRDGWEGILFLGGGIRSSSSSPSSSTLAQSNPPYIIA